MSKRSWVQIPPYTGMDVSDAITYSMKKEFKVAKWGTPKKSLIYIN
jgi:hypothetical protein